ncbi:hypothetical protein CPB83DRAFT_897055 [Crepidotus variabilis]|uniref:DUF7330 domain-containing protein n=1 Tax=Crepidotus variabilis TaxID=179855 RepID=A0A9P6EAT4_9AGAR|nr:hypothetical protein CPB83DRAFT_897055 [Crepidotus variabilis]
MIIAPEEASTKEQRMQGEVIRVGEADPPPSYADAEGHASSSRSVVPSHPVDSKSQPQRPFSGIPVPQDIKPSNFTYVAQQHHSVKGVWVIDPAMSIPQSFLPPLGPGETEESRKNLALESTNGSIDSDIFILSSNVGAVKGRKRILIHAGSRNGSVAARIHDGPSSPNSSPRLGYNITVKSQNGSITVHLPRTFRGPIRLKTVNGSMKVSEAIRTNWTQFSDMGGVRRSFLGHFDVSEFTPGQEWEGDDLSVEGVNGGIKLVYDDESYLNQQIPKPKSGNLFGRLFNF